MSQLSETDLLIRCQQGDLKSYAVIYDRYSRAMYYTCLRMVASTADAEDILQEAFMEAFTTLDKLQNKAAFAGWLKRIVINRSLNHLRSKKRGLQWVEVDDLTKFGDEAEERNIDEEAYQLQADAVQRALNGLPDKYRAVVTLHLFEKMSFEEIAALTGAPSATVRSHYLRARQKIATQVSGIKEKNDEG